MGEARVAAWVGCVDAGQEKKASRQTPGPHGVKLGNVGRVFCDANIIGIAEGAEIFVTSHSNDAHIAHRRFLTFEVIKM